MILMNKDKYVLVLPEKWFKTIDFKLDYNFEKHFTQVKDKTLTPFKHSNWSSDFEILNIFCTFV